MITIYVPGVPGSQGSSKSVGTNKMGKPIIISTNKKLKSWRAQVCKVAKQAIGNRPPITGPVTVNYRFVFEAPASRARKPFEVAGWMPRTVTPDLDKLVRAAGDSISSTVKGGAPVLKDDCQIWQYGSVEAIERPHHTWTSFYPHNPYKPGLYIELSETDLSALAPLHLDEMMYSYLGEHAFTPRKSSTTGSLGGV